MNGEELKQYIKRSGMSVAGWNTTVRRLAGITPSCFFPKLSESSRNTKGKRRCFVSLSISRQLIPQRS